MRKEFRSEFFDANPDSAALLAVFIKSVSVRVL